MEGFQTGLVGYIDLVLQISNPNQNHKNSILRNPNQANNGLWDDDFLNHNILFCMWTLCTFSFLSRNI